MYNNENTVIIEKYDITAPSILFFFVNIFEIIKANPVTKKYIINCGVVFLTVVRIDDSTVPTVYNVADSIIIAKSSS